MRLHVVSIVLDGQPFIEHHLPALNASGTDFKWHIREGAARNVQCTSWCKPQEPRLSNDGTHEYLDSIKADPRIDFQWRIVWNGKLEMFNHMLQRINEPCILLQVDADELWEPEQFAKLVHMFEAYRPASRAYFRCHYFVGPQIITAGPKPVEWLRAWRFEPGMTFRTHEPPVLTGATGPYYLSADFTKSQGLVFSHKSYVTEAQVRFKEQFYGYNGATENWRRLQQNTRWPVKLREFLPWAPEHEMADRL